MAYIKKIMKLKGGIEVHEYHDCLHRAIGMKRTEKKNSTREAVRAVNQRQKEQKCRWKLMHHFTDHDLYITLTYQKDRRPEDMSEAKKDFQQFLKKLRKEYKRYGHEMKWIRNIEKGSKGAYHIHMVLNRIPDLDVFIREAWQFGKVDIQLMYSTGGYRKLAAYLTKVPETCSRISEADYSASRNLPLPEPIKKVYLHRNSFTGKDIKQMTGYYLDKDSVYEGINPITGYPYRVYTFLQVRRE